jgi:hypothetical protein
MSKKDTTDEPTFNKKSLDESSQPKKNLKKKRIKRKVQKEPEIVSYEDTIAAEKIEHIDEGLREIYTNDHGDMPDMTRFHIKRQGHVIRAVGVLVVSLLFLGLAAWYGFFNHQLPSRFSEQDVILSIFGNEELVAGDPIRYRIKFQNDQNVPLAQSTLLLRYPEGFQFVSSSIPAINEFNDTWQLGTIDANAGDVIEIFGHMYGDVGDEQSIRAFLNYTPTNFSSEFQKVEHLRTTILENPISVLVQGPEKIGIGEVGMWVFTVSDATIPVQFELMLPDTFQITNTEPAADMDSPRKFTLLPEAEDRTIMVEGMFGAAGTTTSTLSATLSGTTTIEDELFTYALHTASFPIVLSEESISTRMVMNGAMGNVSIQAGELLNTSIFIKNGSDTTMEDVSVRFLIDAPSDGTQTIFNWAEILDEGDGSILGEQRDSTTRRATILWTPEDVSELAQIEPGEEVVINFSLPVYSSEDIDLTTFTTARASATADIQYTSSDTREAISTSLATMTINSDLRFNTLQEIDTDIDGTDIYRLTYAFENSFHALTDIELEVDVYGNSEITIIDVPAGEAQVDQDAKRLTWNIAEMPLGLDILPLQFEVRVLEENPTQTNLTSKVRIQATDAMTKERITIVGSEVLLHNAEISPEIEA